MLRALLFAFPFTAVTGCAAMSDVKDRAYEVVDEQLVQYCTQYNEGERQAFRDLINSKLSAADLEIICAE